jgi:hypothetical protein
MAAASVARHRRCCGCCACAIWVRSTALIAVAAAIDVPASKMLRQLSAPWFDDFELLGPLSLLPPGILLSYFTMKTDNYSVAGLLTTQRNPRWLAEVSIGSA